MNKKEDSIYDFIKRRFFGFGQEYWNNGNCYYFALILKNRFNLDIYYDQVEGHFVAGYEEDNSLYLFDYNGRYFPTDGAVIKLTDIETKDHNWYNRLKNNCWE